MEPRKLRLGIVQILKAHWKKEVLRSEIFPVRPVYHLIHCAMSLPAHCREPNELLRTRLASRRRRSGRRAMAICDKK
ncbi:Uncharacterised protein [Salmonella enterica subsp. arizonae]|uniref:Uncharacterized protein n=1 Tax=Salmonella enterica subsp. arizonae TaxID=59203 RepID=A0A3S4I9D1_SALER|nr:Uncharacterised protein [Salmonella enterica subsp. arizonae]